MSLDEQIAACEAIDGGRNREAYETKAAHALRLLPALIARDRARGEVVEAAESFILTMAFRHSGVEGRVVPSGFTGASFAAAIALSDALAAIEEAGQ